ncbi:MAG: arsenate reductase [unclassified Hahellaceae]|nr:arsenate reductase [Hahellaceae bacterium]|tara:strand:- start:36169 stop:36576 length:408 start_codon:yes stop_codon:yes gene_type:complete
MTAPEQAPVVMGIPNCDSVKKARRWLEERSTAYEFRDVRKQPLSTEEVASLLAQTGAAAFVNRRSSSWRTLDQRARDVVETAIERQDDPAAQASLVALMTDNQTMIKRPVLVLRNRASTGFSAEGWEKTFAERSD